MVGGISWTSTLDYYRLINEGVNQKLGGLNSAELVLCSLNFAEVQQRSWEGVYELFLEACQVLKSAKVDALVLGANTAHMYADRLEQEIQLPLINIITETAQNILTKGVKKVGLLGTKFTMEMDFYRDKLESYGLQVIIPDSEDTRAYIQHVVKEELGRGDVRPESKEKFIAIAQDLINQGAEGIILGCTEIPLLVSQSDFDFPVFDTTQIHATAIVNYLLS